MTPKEEGAEIAVTARLAGDRVQIIVADTGAGCGEQGIGASGSTGVGLANIRDRLSQAYGEDHRFETQARAGRGFQVLIDIPFQTETPRLEAA